MLEQENSRAGQKILLYAAKDAGRDLVALAEETLQIKAVGDPGAVSPGELCLRIGGQGAWLVRDGWVLQGDFTKSLSRLTPNNLNHELLVRAARQKGSQGFHSAVDATAGLGDDAFLLAAAGFHVQMYERNPVIALLLHDALRRGAEHPELAPIVGRMELRMGDSVIRLPQLTPPPDVVVLDPMFPDKQKTGLTKKKLQILQQLEQPCLEEAALLNAALACRPRKIVVKRPLKGPYLAGRKPSYTLKGKTIRYDCIVPAGEKDEKSGKSGE